MILNRNTIAKVARGEEPGEPPESKETDALEGVSDDERMAVLDSMVSNKKRSPLVMGGGLPGDDRKKISGRAPPLSQQARTGRPALLGGR